MSAPTGPEVRTIVSEFLTTFRHVIDKAAPSPSALPRWLGGSRVTAGVVGSSLVLHFDEGQEGTDSLDFVGVRRSDAEVLGLPIEHPPSNAHLSLQNFGRFITIAPYGKGAPPILELRADSGLTDCGRSDTHESVAVLDVALSLGEVGFKQVGLLLILDRRTTASRPAMGVVAARCLPSILIPGPLRDQSELSDHLIEWRQSHCIVIGKDTERDLTELVMVKDRLGYLQFQAHLIKDLPEIPMMSNLDKATTFMECARFVIAVDVAASGHLTELPVCRSQWLITAILRPKGDGSTFMVGDAPPDVGHERVFEYDSSPLEALPAAVEWANKVAKERAAHYNSHYPWRSSPAGLLRGGILPAPAGPHTNGPKPVFILLKRGQRHSPPAT